MLGEAKGIAPCTNGIAKCNAATTRVEIARAVGGLVEVEIWTIKQ